LKKTQKFFSLILIFSIVTLSSILFTNDITTAKAAGNIYLSDTNLTLELDHYKTIRARGTSGKVSWYTSDSRVASVSGSGKVFAKAPGSATITAYVGGQRLRCKVNVICMKENVTLSKNQTSTLTVFGAKGSTTYISSDPSVVSVSENGKLTAKQEGVATITASVDGKELSSKVSVIGITPSSVVLELGGWSGFVKTLKIENASGKITWSTSNKSIATVSSDGIVKAQSPGTATITAAINGKKLTSTVKVIQASDKEFILRMGKTKVLKILGTNNTVTWDSNKKTVATVSADGTVTPVSEGTALIFGFVDGRRVIFDVTVAD
jgi:uncharacterized protein YjdB